MLAPHHDVWSTHDLHHCKIPRYLTIKEGDRVTLDAVLTDGGLMITRLVRRDPLPDRKQAVAHFLKRWTGAGQITQEEIHAAPDLPPDGQQSGITPLAVADYNIMNYTDLITIEPGMRITVYDVLEYLASGMTEDEILEDFSELTSEDIRACLAFAADRERKLFTPAA